MSKQQLADLQVTIFVFVLQQVESMFNEDISASLKIKVLYLVLARQSPAPAEGQGSRL